MAKKGTLRSDTASIVKDFSILEKLPLRPLTKRDIIGRFNGIRGAVSFKETPAPNVLSERKTAHLLANEIEDLYQRFGLKTVVQSTLILKVLKTKEDYYKSRKNQYAAARFSADDIVSFKAKKQPRETLQEDISWYEAKLQGSPGSLGSVDRATFKRYVNRVKKKSSIIQQEKGNGPA